ncbi:MAG: hypothetical protein JNM99_20195 [Verrucomicrobiaceae bacterium]|nr:hypothetical protein [Verrucomicrobiaceae bacterium]
MNTFQLLRIIVMVACIFAAGIATGRYTSPAPTPVAAQFSGTEGRTITPQMLVSFLDQRLKLAPRQKQIVLGEAQSFVNEIAKTAPATKERFDVFHRTYPRLRAMLRPDQYAAFDAMVKTHEEKMAEILKGKQ